MAEDKNGRNESLLPQNDHNAELDRCPAHEVQRLQDTREDAPSASQSVDSNGKLIEFSSSAAVSDIVIRLVEELVPNPRNARKHGPEQVTKVAASMREFGCNVPILIDGNNVIVAGHCRVTAAKELGWMEVPTICLNHLTQEQIKAYAIADNRLGDLSDWDDAILAFEIQNLIEIDVDFDIGVIGFDTAEIDLLLEETDLREAQAVAPEEIELPERDQPVTTVMGDLWQLDSHRLVCGNALDGAQYDALMAGEKAQMAFSDPPYNVPIDGHVCGLGAANHGNFEMASGEMTPEEFTAFLQGSFHHLVANSTPGSIHFICIDWRHLQEILAAGSEVYTELKNLLVWVKTNGGMGTFYRSQHELILAFKNGKARHINNFKLGEKGRYRTNVWRYAGVNTFRKGRKQDLEAHPTVKPTEMVADAIRDCSNHGDIILDPFAGSGTTLLAAERTKRRARCMEIDPRYVDVAIRRWQDLTGKDAILEETNETFAAASLRRDQKDCGFTSTNPCPYQKLYPNILVMQSAKPFN